MVSQASPWWRRVRSMGEIVTTGVAGNDACTVMHEYALWMKGMGTAAVSDIFSSFNTMDVWRDVGMQGLVQREFLGFDPERMSVALKDIDTFELVQHNGLTLRPAAHAPYSTPPQTLRAALGVRGSGPVPFILPRMKQKCSL